MKRPVLDPELLAAIHPGQILLEDYLKPLAMSQVALARDLRMPASHINLIVRGRRGLLYKFPYIVSAKHTMRGSSS